MNQAAGAMPSRTTPGKRPSERQAVMLTRIAIVLAIVVGWESLARSGLLYRDVVPPLPLIGREMCIRDRSNTPS